MTRFATARLHLVGAAAVLASVLSWGTGVARTWHVPDDAPTIQAGIDSAGVGDDVLVAPGIYQEHEIAMKAGVWVHSQQGAETTVDAGGMGTGFTCVDLQQQSTIEGFTITNGHSTGGDIDHASGGAIRCLRAIIMIRGCIISHCIADGVAGGIYALDSEVTIDACRIEECSALEGGGIEVNNNTGTITITNCNIADNSAFSSGGGGIAAVSPTVTIVGCVVSGNLAAESHGGGIACQSPALTIRDCLVIHNQVNDYYEGGGVLAYNSSGTMTGCTIADNMGVPMPPGAVLLEYSTIAISNTIVAFNEGPAFSCWSSQISFYCSDSYGNTGGDGICGNDLGGNFSADPLFCNHDDYTLDGQSPCLPGNHPDGVDCGLIGARGAGCGTPPTGACCFANGSCLVLEASACGEQGGNYMGNGTTCDPNECEPTPVEPTTWGRIKAGYR